MFGNIVSWHPNMEHLGPAVAAVGVFDGVHIGHQALLRETATDATERAVESIAVTFDRDPDQVVSPDTAAPQLLTLAQKLAAIGRVGVGTILVIPFTPQIAEMTPEQFLEDVLLVAIAPVAVHVGVDFKFGAKAAGDLKTLQRFGLRHDFRVIGHDLVASDGRPVTSTRIRNLIAAGEIEHAAELLGKQPTVTGVVHRGRGMGAAIGFPTANVVPGHYAALPKDGVYAGRVRLDDATEWPAAINVGRPMMYPQATDVLEAHLIGFSGNLQERSVTITFWKRLRDQMVFGSTQELAAAIADDVEYSQRALQAAAAQ